MGSDFTVAKVISRKDFKFVKRGSSPSNGWMDLAATVAEAYVIEAIAAVREARATTMSEEVDCAMEELEAKLVKIKYSTGYFSVSHVPNDPT